MGKGPKIVQQKITEKCNGATWLVIFKHRVTQNSVNWRGKNGGLKTSAKHPDYSATWWHIKNKKSVTYLVIAQMYAKLLLATIFIFDPAASAVSLILGKKIFVAYYSLEIIIFIVNFKEQIYFILPSMVWSSFQLKRVSQKMRGSLTNLFTFQGVYENVKTNRNVL